MNATIGVIGGSGLADLPGLTDLGDTAIPTPFGQPSAAIKLRAVGDVVVAFLPRHGIGHRLLPSEVPYQANIWAMKSLGVRYLLSVSAVGSLQEEFIPGHFVLPDQYFDRTQGRAKTFFGNGIVGHIEFAHPTSNAIRQLALKACESADVRAHQGGTYVAMEGPAFSTKAESAFYRSLGHSVVGMTALPEALLAREAEIAYATLAMVTDFDCWHPEHGSVSVDQVRETMANNMTSISGVLGPLIEMINVQQPTCPAHQALDNALFTDLATLDADTRARLAPILKRFDD